MSETDDIIRAFNVHYYDEWLDIDDFTTLKAENEKAAQTCWEEEHRRDDRQQVTSIEQSYSLNKTKIERHFGNAQMFEA